MHLIEVVGHLVQLGIEQLRLGGEHLEIGAAARLIELTGVLDILGQDVDTLGLELRVGIVAVIADEGVRHLVACREDGVLPRVVSLLVLQLRHLQVGDESTAAEDGLQQVAEERGDPLAGIDGTAEVAKAGRGSDGDVRIELRTGGLHIVEAGSQRHLGIVNVGTVLQQGKAHSRGKLGGQRLLGECRAGNLLTSLTDEQRQGILRSPNLATELIDLRLCGQVGSLGALHTGGAHASEVILQLHHLPRLLGHLAHLGDDGQLLVEHQQGVVAVGNAADDLCTNRHLVVLHAQELHLRGALLRQDVAEEV